jgi:hypothetical protein
MFYFGAAMLAPSGPPRTVKPYFACTPIDFEYYTTAPQRFVNRAEFDVTPAQLFAIFEEETSWPRWVPGIVRVDWTSPRPFGVGTTRTVTFVGGGMEVYEDFIGWEPGRTMAFCFTGTSQDVWESFGEQYVVEDLGGRCRLTWTVAYTPRGTFATLHPLLRPFMGLTLSWFLRRLVSYTRKLP